MDDDGAGDNIMVLGHLVGDSIGGGIVLYCLVILSSVFRYVILGIISVVLSTGEVKKGEGQHAILCIPTSW